MSIRKIITALLLVFLVLSPANHLQAFDELDAAYCDPCGCGYTDCRGMHACSTAIAIGIVVFAVMYAILVADGKVVHAH